MTAIALKTFDRQPRTQAAPRRHDDNKTEKFSNFVEKADKSIARTRKDATKDLLEDNDAAQNDALHALLQTIPPSEMPSGGVPEAIANEISIVIDVPHDLPVKTEGKVEAKTEATNLALASSIVDLLPKPAPQVQAQVPVHVEDEISDGVPIAIEAGPRPKLKKLVDDEAITLAMPIPSAMRELGRANTELAMPVEGIKAKSITQVIPQAIPVLPEVVANMTPVAPTPFAVEQLPLTPLEQAVQDLIGEIGDKDDKKTGAVDVTASYLPEVKLLSVEHADAAPAVVGVKEPQNPVENANPSHVHLVIDDGAERVVVTVAVRGSEVNVALRGQDDATTAALARNAGSLDHAMRARGLDLAGLMTGREPESQKQRPDREQRNNRAPKEQFSIEELA